MIAVYKQRSPSRNTGLKWLSIRLGDFNQRIPRGTQPVKAFEALQDALASRFVVATAGVTDSRSREAIDHLAHTPDLVAAVRGELPSREPEGPRLSDHFGLLVDIQKVDVIR